MAKIDTEGLQRIVTELRSIGDALSRHIADADKRVQDAEGTDLQRERLVLAGLVQTEEAVCTAQEAIEITLAKPVPKSEWTKVQRKQ